MQEQAGELPTLDPKYFCKVERGETTISIARLYALSKALGTNVRELTRDFLLINSQELWIGY